MNISASNLPSSFSFLCFGSNSNPFFRIYRVRDRDELLIYESETAYDNLNPTFNRVQLSERRLCKNDPDRKFQIRFYNYSITGAHSYIGSVETTVNRILDPRNYPIINSKNQEKGNIRFSSIKRYVRYRFMDFMSVGLQLLLITCIDFTASNGSPNSPQSLHYLT